MRADGDFLLGGLALKRLDGVVWLGVSLLEGNLFGEGLLSKTNVVVHLIYIILTYNQIQYHPPHDLLPPIPLPSNIDSSIWATLFIFRAMMIYKQL